MDFWTFISKIVASISWPIVVIVIFYWFREPLKSLINRIRKIHWPGGKLLLNELLPNEKNEKNFNPGAFDKTDDSKLANESTKLLAYYTGFLATSFKKAGACEHIQRSSAQTFHNAFTILQKRMPESDDDIKKLKKTLDELRRGN